jgi:hypothetical protein
MRTKNIKPVQTMMSLLLFFVCSFLSINAVAQNEIDSTKVKGSSNSYSISNIEYIFGEGYNKFNAMTNKMGAVYAKDGYKFILIKGDFKSTQEWILFNNKDVLLSYKQNDSIIYCELFDAESEVTISTKKAGEKLFTYNFKSPTTLVLYFEIPKSISDQLELKFIDTSVKLVKSSK